LYVLQRGGCGAQTTLVRDLKTRGETTDFPVRSEQKLLPPAILLLFVLLVTVGQVYIRLQKDPDSNLGVVGLQSLVPPMLAFLEFAISDPLAFAQTRTSRRLKKYERRIRQISETQSRAEIQYKSERVIRVEQFNREYSELVKILQSHGLEYSDEVPSRSKKYRENREQNV
jgi:hypothetical protein